MIVGLLYKSPELASFSNSLEPSVREPSAMGPAPSAPSRESSAREPSACTVHLVYPELEPWQQQAFRNRRELTLLIGGSAAAERLLYQSRLYAPMEDHFVDYQRQGL